MTTTTTMKMSRDELIADAVEAMVAQWGEVERAGCVKMVAAKHTRTLQMDRQMRLGEALTTTPSDYSRNIASGATEDGHS